MRAQLGTVVNCLLPHTGRCRGATVRTLPTRRTAGCGETGVRKLGHFLSLSLSLQKTVSGTGGPADVVGQQRNDAAEKGRGDSKGCDVDGRASTFSRHGMASRSRLAVHTSPVDGTSYPRTYSRVSFGFVDRPQARQPACCLCQEPAPGITKTWQGGEKSPVFDAFGRRVTASRQGRREPGQARQAGGGAQNPLKGDGTVRPCGGPTACSSRAAAPPGLFKLGSTSRRFPSRPRFQVLLLPCPPSIYLPREKQRFN